MHYHHPTIRIEQPAPGHYVISGHNPASVLVPETGHVVPLAQCYIPPELPTEVLLAIIKDRGDAESSPDHSKSSANADGGHRPPLQQEVTKRAAKGGRK